MVMMEVAPHAEFGGCGLSGRRKERLRGAAMGSSIEAVAPANGGNEHKQSGGVQCATQPVTYDRRSRKKRHPEARKRRRRFPEKSVAFLSSTIQIPPLYNA